jgi:putative two-component system response regulator
LAVPAAGSVWIVDPGADIALLPWISALVPGFLLAYHKGWRGSATALAGGMAILPIWNLVLSVRGLPVPSWERVTLMVSAYIAFSVGLGFVTELLLREREKAEDHALVDPLTGLPNRRHAEVFLRAAATSARATRSPLSVLLIEIDRFQWLLDTHGQGAGDRVLEAVARLARDRASAEWFLARSGPGQLMAILPQVTRLGAVRFAETVREEVERLDLRWQPITVSAGVASAVGPAVRADQLLSAAESGLAHARELGPGRVEVAGPEPERLAGGTRPAQASEGLSGSPRGIVALPVSQRASVRHVLELNGLRVEEYDGIRQVPFEGGDGTRAALLVTAVATESEVDEVLALLEGILDRTVPRVVFLTAASGDPPAQPAGAVVLRGEPSGERLLPIVGSLLAGSFGTGRAPAQIEGGFASRLAAQGAPLTVGRILVVEDERHTRAAIQRALQGLGFRDVVVCASGEEALVAVVEDPPDLMVLDLHLPGMDGFGVLEALRPLLGGDGFLPVLVVTGEQAWEHRQRALRMGAKDLLHKPFDVAELGARVLNLMETRKLHLQLRDANSLLEARVQQRTRELALAKDEILFRLARAAEYRDDITGRHATRVGAAAAVLAEALGLDAAECEIVRLAAPLHDVGKIGIPDSILLKRGNLTAEEMEVMKRHTTIGADLLAHSTSQVVEAASVIALTHHERWDGRGYPQGLRGEDIPMHGRLVAVADALDALTHVRPYKGAIVFEDAIVRLLADSGSAFDPAVTAALKASAFRVRDIVLDRSVSARCDEERDVPRPDDYGPVAERA